jgi:hypothetical protein
MNENMAHFLGMQLRTIPIFDIIYRQRHPEQAGGLHGHPLYSAKI